MSKGATTYLLSAVVLIVALLASSCGSSRNASRHTAHNGRPVKIEQHIKIDKKHMPRATVSLLAEADTWLGVPYRYGGEDRNGIDCSALVLNVFSSSLKIKMPRNSRKQYEFCSPVKRKNIVPGDLVFFSTPSSSEIGHVGIYIGDDRMIHSSSSRGVIISSLNDNYFQRHFKGAGRIDSYFAMVGEPAKAEPTTPTTAPTAAPEISLSEYIAQNSQSSQSSQPARSSQSSQTIQNTQSSQSTQPPQLAQVAKVAQPAISESDARESVLEHFKEAPADSVLTSFFE